MEFSLPLANIQSNMKDVADKKVVIYKKIYELNDKGSAYMGVEVNEK